MDVLKNHIAKLIEYKGEYTAVREMRKHLKGSTQVYVGNGKENIADVAQYLSVHAKLPKLRNWGE